MVFSQYHIVGVAGVGMSALAHVLCDRGCVVTGSDRHDDRGDEGSVLATLERSGVGFCPQDGSGVATGVDAVVVSTAIEDDNPDVVAARARRVPVLHRSEVLAQLVEDKTCIAVAGTCGKSTVTGMVGWILAQTGRDPTVVNGAPVINWCNDQRLGNVRRGGNDLWVIEADESDRSLLSYTPTYAVITNMSADHFDLAETRQLFERFASRVQRKVIGALDDDNPLAGIEPEVTASSSFWDYAGVNFELSLPGRHNVENAMHAARLCECVGVPLAQSAEALKSFRGIRRRLEVVGNAGGITVIDDYGHNPAKIRAAWEAVVPFCRRGIVIWCPHGYGPLRSMLEALIDTFCDLCGPEDRLLLLPVYDAGGTADRSISANVLAERLMAAGVSVSCVESHDEALASVLEEAQPDDVVVVMGARDPQLPALARQIVAEEQKVASPIG